MLMGTHSYIKPTLYRKAIWIAVKSLNPLDNSIVSLSPFLVKHSVGIMSNMNLETNVGSCTGCLPEIYVNRVELLVGFVLGFEMSYI